ncbi:MAG: ABC transporter permease [Phycisphaerales bacterium]|nr:ABC transporter permease [Phycisphaerales bacterium]
MPQNPQPNDIDDSVVPANNIFQSRQRRGVIHAPIYHFSQMWQRRSLISFIVSGNLRASVINTILGRLWHLIPPIVQISVYFVVVNFIFSQGGEGPKEIFVTIAVGILHWSFLSLTISSSTTAITRNDSLLKQSPVPPVIFVGVLFREQLQQFAIKIGILAVIVLAWGPDISWRIALYPVWIGMLLLNTWSLALIVATLSVFYRDLEKATGLFVLMTMYLCPVIYGVSFLTATIGAFSLLDILMVNPLAVNMAMLKWSILGNPSPGMWHIILFMASSLCLFIVAHQVYERNRATITKSL